MYKKNIYIIFQLEDDEKLMLRSTFLNYMRDRMIIPVAILVYSEFL